MSKALLLNAFEVFNFIIAQCLTCGVVIAIGMIPIAIAQPNIEDYQEEFIGYIINDNDIGTHSAFVDGDSRLLIFDLLSDNLDVTLQRQETGGYILNTPVGNMPLTDDDVIEYNGTILISTAALIKKARFTIDFDSANYAVNIFPPWFQSIGTNGTDTIEPDIVPKAYGINQLSAEFNYNQFEDDNGTRDSHQNLYTVSGNAAGGLYYSEYQQQNSGVDDRLEEYYWVKGWENQQVLAGLDTISPNILIPSVEITGVQYAYSNESISESNNRQVDIDSFYNNINNNRRRIIGFTEPGAVARLEINGEFVAAQITNQDGRYDFDNAEIDSRAFNQIEVVVLNRQRTEIIERVNYSQQSNVRLLKQGQYLAYAGAGATGNALTPIDGANNDQAAYSLLSRYGVNEALTLQASALNNGKNQFQSTGLSATLFQRVALNLDFANNSDTNANATSATVTSYNDNWDFISNFSTSEESYRSENDDYNRLNRAELSYRGLDNSVISLIALDQKDGSSRSSYVLPGLDFYGQYWNAQLRPDFDGDYQLGARYYNGKLSGRLDADFDGSYFINNEYGITDEFNIFNNNRFNQDISDLYEVGVQWVSLATDQTDKDLTLSLLADDQGQLGYNVRFEHNLHPGIILGSEYIDSPSLTDSSSNQRLSIDLRFNYSYNGRRFVASDLYFPSLDYGSISGKLEFPEGIDTSFLDEIEKLPVKVNGITRYATLDGHYFQLQNVRHGINRVSLGAANLPIEYSPDINESYLVRIDPGAVSYVTLTLEVKVGFAGRITDNQNQPVTAANITLYNNDKVISSTYSDQFGLYRIDAVPPGSYTLSANTEIDHCLGQREITLENQYIFDQDIRLNCTIRNKAASSDQ